MNPPGATTTTGAKSNRAQSAAIEPDVEVIAIDLAACASVLIASDTAAPRLSEDECDRARLIGDGELAGRWRLTRIATRLVLERWLGPSVRQRAFDIAEGGKPGLIGAGIDFSISHTGAAALVAVARAQPIGVDLECAGRAIGMSPERRQRVVAAAERLGGPLVLSPPTSATQQRAPGADDGLGDHRSGRANTTADGVVLAAWVRLEALAKVDGGGIGRLLTREGVVGGGATGTEPARYHTRDLTPLPGYVAAVAAPHLPSALPLLRFPAAPADLAHFLGARRGISG